MAESEIDPVQQWQQWVPMDKPLYSTLQLAQLCMLQRIDEMFAAAQIPYWLCGGTLIGAIRHEGFIPHDDDIDVECFDEDLDKIAAIPLDPPFYTGCDPLAPAGNWEGHPVIKLHFFGNLLTVDIFPRPSSLPEGERHFPSNDEVFPLTRYQFCNIQVWGPNRDRCSAYLDRCYGKDWRSVVCVWNHDFNWCYGIGFNPRKQTISVAEYNSIVAKAGVPSPVAEASAQTTFQKIVDQDIEQFYENYKKYRFQRVWRRNRAFAEYKEKLQAERENH